ncbi:hypothetical protein C3920_01190 [Novacetimonas pomaceti]|uniref:Uncharacterized protein n=1 Tax=Novacetimonas pomaceti TaxID=2021998 RepID=A0ABX5P5Q6_9PROT|nr:hypothetical protein C3920_01190 [Novacetimonas pomaceti]
MGRGRFAGDIRRYSGDIPCGAFMDIDACRRGRLHQGEPSAPAWRFPDMTFPPEPGPDKGFFPFMERKGSSILPVPTHARAGRGGNIGALRIPQRP